MKFSRNYILRPFTKCITSKRLVFLALCFLTIVYTIDRIYFFTCGRTSQEYSLVNAAVRHISADAVKGNQTLTVCLARTSKLPFLLNPLCFQQPKQQHDLNVDMAQSWASTLLLVWCGDIFRFEHYISILSALHILGPSSVRFYYSNKEPSANLYHQWLPQLKLMIPMFFSSQDNGMYCANGDVTESQVLEKLTTIGGGIYINSNVILNTQFANFLKMKNLPNDKKTVLTSTNSGWPRMLMALVPQKFETETKGDKNTKRGVFQVDMSDFCINFSLEKNDSKSVCYYNKKIFYPEDIWLCDSYACELCRRYIYGQSSKLVPSPSKDALSPNIVHYIWHGSKPMSLSFMLSILSFIHIQHVEAVYIHCDSTPQGRFWQTLQQYYSHKDKIKLVYRPKPMTIYGQALQQIAHVADVTKADISYRYGGIIADVDLIMFKKLNQSFREYDFVVNYDIGKYNDFPEILNLGIIISKASNTFAKMWLESAKEFNDSSWLWNAGLATYKIYEHNPTAVLTSRTLQAFCFTYRYFTAVNKSIYHHFLNNSYQGLQFSFKNPSEEMPYSFHFTWPDVYFDLSYLAGQTGFLGELGQYVMKTAGLSHLVVKTPAASKNK